MSAASADGYRVLIDRLWPRGVSRERAKLDGWEKDLPPSTGLSQWFGHDPSHFEEFRRRYIGELSGQRAWLTVLRRQARDGTLTLVYSAHDTEHNDAVVLAEVLRRGLPKGQSRRGDYAPPTSGASLVAGPRARSLAPRIVGD
jgi:uncharacterized protein YeaO (DUF488 family)